jgi:hypothetical protein
MLSPLLPLTLFSFHFRHDIGRLAAFDYFDIFDIFAAGISAMPFYTDISQLMPLDISD